MLPRQASPRVEDFDVEQVGRGQQFAAQASPHAVANLAVIEERNDDHARVNDKH